MSEIKTIKVKIKCKVFEEIEYFPLTGTYNIEENTSGFVYDRTYASNKSNLRTQINTSIGGFEYNLIEGTNKKHWDGGIISGCKYDGLIKEKFKWVPKISEGQYTLFDKSKNFFSDTSCCKIIESNEVILPLNILENSIEIALYKRDNDYNNIQLYKWTYKEHQNIFNNSLHYNILRRENDYLITLNKFIVKDKFFPLEERSELITMENISSFLEEKGIGNDSSRIIYTNYFPIMKDQVQLFSVLDDVIYEWDLVDDINYIFEEDTRRCFEIDYEKGLIKTSGLNIQEEIKIIKFNNFNKTLEVDTDLKTWPNKGIFKSNNLFYSFNGRDKYSLHQIKNITNDEGILLERNHMISFCKQGYSAPKEEMFFLNYSASPRIDFSFYDSYRLENKINLKPIYMTKTNGILQISPQEKHVSSIELVASKDKIVLGNDTVYLTATCFNGNKKAVNDVLVTFSNLTEDINIKFEGDSSSISNLSNTFGFVKTSLLVPFSSSESLSLVSDNVNQNEIIFSEDLSKMIIQDITLFQILAYNGIEKINDLNSYLNLDVDYKPELIERLVYKWKEDAINPATKENGAYTIVKPTETKTNSLVFDFNLLPCVNSNNESIIYKYKIYFSRVCKLQASCIDPATGNLIKSNEILLRIDLPLHMKGINTLGIPYGFGFKNNLGDAELKVLGTGLGGANFITINPSVQNIFNIRVSE